ncbi:phage tail protein [Butyrivibrio sp. MB2005]|uniref:phage tail protein n=1 Tax=Butyrivibrio sp. MB2005 TaxID=1280678 RepID=UPI0006862E55|nr:phage tail protein [Butyrivibrio sp. MB2005]
MIYKIYCDDNLIYDSRDDEKLILNPIVDLEVNMAGSLSFIMLPGCSFKDSIKRMKSTLTVYRDKEIIFTGRVTEVEDDFLNRRSVYCEGALAFFNDSIQPFAEYHGITVRGYLERLVSVHNSQVEKNRQFTVGIVTARDANDSLYRFTNYNNTITEIKEDLINDIGGYISIRNEDGILYVDYLDDYLDTSDQKIEFGENLLDFTKGFNTTDLATRIIPLGSVLESESTETIKKRLTIEEVNNGKNYIESTDAIESFGIITKTVIWDDVTTASALFSKGKKYLQESQFDNMTIECSAIDLHYADDNIPAFTVGQYAWVVSNPHGLNKRFPISALSLSLDNIADNTITLGITDRNRTLTGASKEANAQIMKKIENIPDTDTVLDQAKRNATNLINKATHGFVVVEPNEVLVMDTNDKSTAKKIWRWNQGGLGFSKNGYKGDFPLAITQDGAIVADYISTGKLDANLIKTGIISDEKGQNFWNMETGEFSLQTGMIGDTSIENIQDAVSKGIIDVDIEYAQNSSMATAPTSGWSTTAPSWVNGKYIWQRTKTTTADGKAEYSAATCITGAKGATGATGAAGAKGDKGDKGDTGSKGAKGDKGDTGEKGETGAKGAKGDTGATGPAGKDGKNGVDGKNGSDGKGATAIVEQYYLSSSNTTQTGGSWQTTCPAWKSGYYIWTRSAITWTDKTTTYTTPTLANGINSANTTANTANSTANTAKTTADNTKKTLDNLKIGGRNLILGTAAAIELYPKGGENENSNTSSGAFTNFAGDANANYPYKIACGTLAQLGLKNTDYLTISFDWNINIAEPSGKFRIGFNANPWEMMAGDIVLSKTNTGGHFEKSQAVSATTALIDSTATAIRIRMDKVTSGATIKIWNLKIEIGQKATAWTPAPEDLQSYADKVAAAAVANQTQSSIFNKLTNNGQTQGIYLKDGKLYINAEYIASGILKSKDGETFYLDLEKGILNMKATKLTLMGTRLTNLWRNTSSLNKIGTDLLSFVSGEKGIWMGDSNNSTNGTIDLMDITSNQPEGVPVTNSFWLKPYNMSTQGVGQSIPIDAGKYMFSFYYRAKLNPNLLRNTADKKIDSTTTDTGWVLKSSGDGVGSVVTGYDNLGTTDRYVLPYPLAYAITGNTTGNKDYAQKVSLTKGKTYVLSWYARLVNNCTSAAILIRNWNVTTNACELTLYNSKITNTVWQRFCVKFTATNENSENTNIQFGISGAGSVQFACVKLEQADFCTLYVPNTADASYKETDQVYFRVLYRWGNTSSYGYYFTEKNTIAEIKAGKWNRFVAEENFTKNKDTSNKLDMKNTTYFLEYETGKFRTKMRLSTMHGISIEYCGMMFSPLSSSETAQSAGASCRWIPNGCDAMIKDSIVSTMTGASSTDTNQGIYLNSSGQLCINASMIKSGTISADKIKTGTLSSIAINNNGNFQVNSGGSVTIKSGNLTIKESDSKLIRFNTSSGIPQIHLTDGSKDTLITPGHIYYTNSKGVYTELTNH